MLREVSQRGLADHVDSCPKKARVWQGKTYANVIHDCSGCESFEWQKNEYKTVCHADGTPSYDVLTHIKCNG